MANANLDAPERTLLAYYQLMPDAYRRNSWFTRIYTCSFFLAQAVQARQTGFVGVQ
jgi:hypothetical protein